MVNNWIKGYETGELPFVDAIIDQAETEAIEAIVNKGIDPDHPAFDRMVDIKQEEIYKELLERPGPHG